MTLHKSMNEMTRNELIAKALHRDTYTHEDHSDDITISAIGEDLAEEMIKAGKQKEMDNLNYFSVHEWVKDEEIPRGAKVVSVV